MSGGASVAAPPAAGAEAETSRLSRALRGLGVRAGGGVGSGGVAAESPRGGHAGGDGSGRMALAGAGAAAGELARLHAENAALRRRLAAAERELAGGSASGPRSPRVTSSTCEDADADKARTQTHPFVPPHRRDAEDANGVSGGVGDESGEVGRPRERSPRFLPSESGECPCEVSRFACIFEWATDNRKVWAEPLDASFDGLVRALNACGLRVPLAAAAFSIRHPVIHAIFMKWGLADSPDDEEPLMKERDPDSDRSDWIKSVRVFGPGENEHSGEIEGMRESGVAYSKVDLMRIVSDRHKLKNYHPREAAKNGGKSSPLSVVAETHEPLRRRLVPPAPGEEWEFPVFKDYYEAGCTEYLLSPFDLPPPYGSQTPAMLALGTRRTNGFSDDDLAFIASILRLTSSTLAFKLERICAHALMEAYVGRTPARKIMAGTMTQLGKTIDIRAVICFCDLRSFTALSVRYSPTRVMDMLGEFFEIIARHVRSPTARGEILKFMGDGALIVFRIDEDDDDVSGDEDGGVTDSDVDRRSTGTRSGASNSPGRSVAPPSSTSSASLRRRSQHEDDFSSSSQIVEDEQVRSEELRCARLAKGACPYKVADAAGRALVALADIASEVDARNESAGTDRSKLMRFCSALHYGVCTYGNVGVSDRMDFTVIGREVNKAARLESVAGKLDAPVVVSAEFKEAAGPNAPCGFDTAGSFALKGFGEQRFDVYVPDGTGTGGPRVHRLARAWSAPLSP